MRLKYAMLFFYLLCFAGANAQVFKNNDTLYLHEDLAMLLYRHDAGYRMAGKDTIVWIGRKQRPISADTRQMVKEIARYDIAADSLSPVSVLNGSNVVIETYYINGEEKVGPYKKYWDNGVLKEEGEYSSKTYFKKLGKWTYYDKSGKVEKVRDYK